MMPQEPTNKRRRQSAGPTTSTNAVACPIAVDDDPRVGVINTLSPIIGSTNPTTSTERHLHPQVHLVRQGPQHTDASTTTIHSTTTTSTSSRDMRTGLNSPSLNSPLYTPLPGVLQNTLGVGNNQLPPFLLINSASNPTISGHSTTTPMMTQGSRFSGSVSSQLPPTSSPSHIPQPQMQLQTQQQLQQLAPPRTPTASQSTPGQSLGTSITSDMRQQQQQQATSATHAKLASFLVCLTCAKLTGVQRQKNNSNNTQSAATTTTTTSQQMGPANPASIANALMLAQRLLPTQQQQQDLHGLQPNRMNTGAQIPQQQQQMPGLSPQTPNANVWRGGS